VTRTVILCCLAVLIFPANIHAQLQKTPPVVEVTLKPETIIPGMRVEVSGTTTHDNKNLDVNITIAPAAGTGSSVAVKTKADASGRYAARTPAIATAGSYVVTVTTNGGKGRATAALQVQSPDGIDERINQTGAASVDMAAEALATMEADVAALPPVPETAGTKVRLDKVEQAIGEGKAQFANFARALQRLNAVTNRYPATQAAMLDVYEAANIAAAEIERQRATTAAQIRASRRAGDICEVLDSVNERLNFLNAFINTIGLQFDACRKASEVSKNWLFNSLPHGVDALADRIPFALPADQKFEATEALKALTPALLGPIGVFSTVSGMILDVTQYMLSKEYAKYCERFEGPMRTNFDMTFFEKGQPYWKYIVTLNGKIGLRYAKPVAGRPAVVRGQIEGVATRVDVREDLRVLQPQVKDYVLFRKVIQPISAVWVEDLGAYARQMTSPSYFKIPVEGTLTGDKLVIKLPAAAQTDFKSKIFKARAIYVLFTPGPLPLPETYGFDLPIQPAYFMLSRSMHNTNTLTLTSTGSGLEAKETYVRNSEGAQHDYKVNIKTEIKICNPGCAALVNW